MADDLAQQQQGEEEEMECEAGNSFEVLCITSNDYTGGEDGEEDGEENKAPSEERVYAGHCPALIDRSHVEEDLSHTEIGRYIAGTNYRSRWTGAGWTDGGDNFTTRNRVLHFPLGQAPNGPPFGSNFSRERNVEREKNPAASTTTAASRGSLQFRDVLIAVLILAVAGQWAEIRSLKDGIHQLNSHVVTLNDTMHTHPQYHHHEEKLGDEESFVPDGGDSQKNGSAVYGVFPEASSQQSTQPREEPNPPMTQKISEPSEEKMVNNQNGTTTSNAAPGEHEPDSELELETISSPASSHASSTVMASIVVKTITRRTGIVPGEMLETVHEFTIPVMGDGEHQHPINHNSSSKLESTTTAATQRDESGRNNDSKPTSLLEAPCDHNIWCKLALMVVNFGVVLYLITVFFSPRKKRNIAESGTYTPWEKRYQPRSFPGRTNKLMEIQDEEDNSRGRSHKASANSSAAALLDEINPLQLRPYEEDLLTEDSTDPRHRPINNSYGNNLKMAQQPSSTTSIMAQRVLENQPTNGELQPTTSEATKREAVEEKQNQETSSPFMRYVEENCLGFAPYLPALLKSLALEKEFSGYQANWDSCIARSLGESTSSRSIDLSTSSLETDFYIKQTLCLLEQFEAANRVEQLVCLLFSIPYGYVAEFAPAEVVLRSWALVHFHSGNFKQLYAILEGHNFAEEHYPKLQQLWWEAHYQEAESAGGRELSPVGRYYVRKKHPVPSTIRDGKVLFFIKTRRAARLVEKCNGQPSSAQAENKWAVNNSDSAATTSTARDDGDSHWAVDEKTGAKGNDGEEDGKMKGSPYWRKKLRYPCPVPGCGKIYTRLSHLEAHIKWHYIDFEARRQVTNTQPTVNNRTSKSCSPTPPSRGDPSAISLRRRQGRPS